MTSISALLLLLLPLVHADPMTRQRRQALLGKGRIATPALQKALAADPNNAALNLSYGLSLHGRGLHDLALPYFQLGEADPDYWSQGAQRHAESLAISGEFSPAAALLEQLVLEASDPAHEQALLVDLATVYRRGGQFDQAEEVIYRAISLRPNGKLGHAALAQLAMDQGDLEAAGFHVYLAEEAIQGKRPPGVHLAGSRLALAQDLPGLALDLAQTARRLQRWNPEAVYYHSASLIALGEVDEAERVLGMVNLRETYHPAVLMARANLAIALARPEEAAAWIETAVAVSPGYPTKIESEPQH